MKYIKIRGKLGITKTKVDDDDYEKLKNYNWKLHHGYVFRHNPRNHKQRSIYLHREIMNTPKGMCTDHKDGDKLNNQKSNLRICNYSQNNANQKLRKQNTSGYKGVSWHIRYKTWKANIRVNNKMIFLGSFKTPEEAYKKYCEASVLYRGEFANFG
jgi:hypothetical protein